MDGLECSEIRMSDVCDTTTLRFDSDYYKKEYLEIEQFICKNRDKFVTIESQGLQVDASAFYPSLEPYYNTGTIPFVRVADVKDQIEYNACVNIPEMGEEFRTLHMCYPGDVVLTKGGRVGTAGLITQPSYVTRDLMFINASALSRKDYIVLYLFFSSSFAYKQMVRSSSMTAQPHLTITLIRDLFLKVFDAMLAFCARALNAIKASCLNSEFGAEHKLLSQMPITNFLQSIEGGKEMTLADKEKAYLWFISFVYRLRNALFHEIIDPLNDEWQVIFKNSYHVLKQVVDQNIWRLKQLKLLPSASQAAAEEDYNREPPPDIDWPTDEEAKFTWFYYEMLKLNKDGARVLLKGKIDFAEHHYETECTVRWNESLSETAIKNASITSVVDSQEKELAAAI